MWPEVNTFSPVEIVISTHTSRVGCDICAVEYGITVIDFYSHIPCGMWLINTLHLNRHLKYFYSHIPCGMWQSILNTAFGLILFLLTHPVWDVTGRAWIHGGKWHISTHTSRVGCDGKWPRKKSWKLISTHTSRVGCDDSDFVNTNLSPGISTHTSRVGCDLLYLLSLQNSQISTHTSRVGCDESVYSIFSGTL